MSPHRFYVPEVALKSSRKLELPDSVGRQVVRVLRMREGDEIALFNGSGSEWPAKIDSVRRDSVSVTIGPLVDPHTDPELQITVCQALIPTERMEFVIQKCTELGVSRVLPVVTGRVQVKDASPSPRRIKRWTRIAVEAAEQSGRTRVPEVFAPVSFADCLARARAEGPVVLLWEEEHDYSLRLAVQESLRGGSGHVSVLIGPVGGLSEAEVDEARSAGALIAGAGPRILRAETAPVVALTTLMYEADELE